MSSVLQRHRVACFVVLTFAITWGAWIPLAVAGRTITPGFSPVYVVGLLGPLLGAVLTTALVSGHPGVRSLLARMVRVRVPLRWWLVGLGAPIAVAAAAYVVVSAYAMFLLAPIELPSAASLARFGGLPITHVLGTWALLVVVTGLGEETGWRGFLLPALMRRRSPLVASLLVGAIWAAWHLPALWINETYRQLPPAAIPAVILGLLGGSVVLAWLYNRGRNSILLVAVWHGTFNLLSGSAGARGALAAAETTAVIAIAAVLIVQELNAGRREHAGRRAWHAMTDEPVPAQPWR